MDIKNNRLIVEDLAWGRVEGGILEYSLVGYN